MRTSHDDATPPASAWCSDEGYRQALAMLHQCATEHGFLATTTEQDNYRRIWSRDSAVIGLAGLLSGQQELVDTCRRSLETLAAYQGPHGEIPSNVDPATERVSYGGTAGRVDADLWFVICCAEYWRVSGDDKFLQKMLEPLEKVRFLLGSWEFNTRGLLYVPPTGDWADEFLQSGYVLYDQLLYLQCLRDYCEIHRRIHHSADHELMDRASRLKHLIQGNYWFPAEGDAPDDVYHEVLYRKGRKAAAHRGGSYWMPFFSPLGYGFRFDAMANVLVMLLEVADDAQCETVDHYIEENIVPDQIRLLPAFSPVITPKDEEWDDLQISYSHTFKNDPYEYHNGGLWPLVTGFYVASLAQRDKHDVARQYCEGIHAANQMQNNGNSNGGWGFAEYLHGQKFEPGGTSPMGWSAAAAVIAEQYIQGNRLFQAKLHQSQ